MPSTHLDHEQVQRLLHRELTPQLEALLRDHLGTCGPCRGCVAAAQREEDEVLTLLAQVDHPTPNIEVAAVVARARRPRVIWTRWAAGGLLAVGVAGAAYAVPGSPARGWVDAVVARWTQAPSPVVAPGAPVVVAPGIGGVAVAPGWSFVVLFQSAQPTGEVRVTVTDGNDVVVQAPSGAATFTSNPDHLVIDNRGSVADFDIEIPRGAPRIEIRIGDRRIFFKEGARITTVVADTGPYRIPLAQQRP